MTSDRRNNCGEIYIEKSGSGIDAKEAENVLTTQNVGYLNGQTSTEKQQ